MENYWKKPKSRSLGVGMFTDLRVFYEALNLTNEAVNISKQTLQEELSQRVIGNIFISKVSDTAIDSLLREMKMFSWIKPITNTNVFTLTNEGKEVLTSYKKNKRHFLHTLIKKMHELYTIPGWFINRLWEINPEGQGQIIIPSPPSIKDWNPTSKKWESKEWDEVLEDQCLKSYNKIQKIDKKAFPINKEAFLKKVKERWEHLGGVTQKTVANMPKSKKSQQKDKIRTYSQRDRLTTAMKEASIHLLFSNEVPNKQTKDFEINQTILPPRIYSAWCPRLLALELIFYTDFHPQIPGRLIFPTSVFRKESCDISHFELITDVKSPNTEQLFLYQPKWEAMEKKFIEFLYTEYRKLYLKVNTLYVPVQDIRDEVCRLLRLSAERFDTFLATTFKKTITNPIGYNISLETDIREGSNQKYRRPILMNNIPYTLITVTKTQQ